MCVSSLDARHHGFSTGVGAIRLFFGSLLSSFSLSLASRFVPATLPVVLLGVSGGVVSGTPVTLPELAATMLGTLPDMSVGLLTTLISGNQVHDPTIEVGNQGEAFVHVV